MTSPEMKVSALQKGLLEKISRQTTSSVREVERANILLLLSSGHSNSEVERQTGISWAKVKRCRRRWLGFAGVFEEIEGCKGAKPVAYELEKAIRECLRDAPRPGSPGKFTAEEYCRMLGLSVEDPALSGRPISQWTISELTEEIVKRQIVPSISRAQVGSFLKKAR